MAEPHHQLHFDALAANLPAIHHNIQAIHYGFPKLLSSCAENTLLLRKLLDILPASTNPTQPHAEPNVFDEMFKTSSDTTCVFGIGANDGSELVDDVSDSHTLVEPEVFDQMPERMGAITLARLEGVVVVTAVFEEMPALDITTPDDTIDSAPVISSSVVTELAQETNDLIPDLGLVLDDALDFQCGKPIVWGSSNVSDSVNVSIESVVQPKASYVEDEAVDSRETLPNKLRRGYPFIDYKYPALTRRFDTPGVIYTAMNCFVSVLPYDLFDFGSISLVVDVDDPYGFRLLVMGRSSPDVYAVSAKVGLLLDMYEQLVDFPFLLQVFETNLECWQTTDLFQSKLFDPEISKHLLDANRLINSRLSVYFVPNAADIVMKNAFDFNLYKADKDKIYGIIVNQVNVSGIMGYMQQQVCSFTKFLQFFSAPLVDFLAFKVNVIAIMVVKHSPFLEILYMVESVDEYPIGQLHDFAGKKLISTTKEGSKLGANKDDNQKLDKLHDKFEGVCKVSAMLTKLFVGIVCDAFLRPPLFSCLVRIWHLPWDSFDFKYSSDYAWVETLLLEGDTVKTTQMCHQHAVDWLCVKLQLVRQHATFMIKQWLIL